MKQIQWRRGSFGIGMTTVSGKLGREGFSIMEVLFALVIFSVALLALNQVSLIVLTGNKEGKNYTEAVLLAQQTIEDLRTRDIAMGSDGLMGTADDTVYAYLQDCASVSNAYTSNAKLFALPDYAVTLDANGNETGYSSCPSTEIVTEGANLKRTWTVKDNNPVTGVKTLIVVVGWQEKGTDRFVGITTVLRGT